MSAGKVTFNEYLSEKSKLFIAFKIKRLILVSHTILHIILECVLLKSRNMQYFHRNSWFLLANDVIKYHKKYPQNL